LSLARLIRKRLDTPGVPAPKNAKRRGGKRQAKSRAIGQGRDGKTLAQGGKGEKHSEDVGIVIGEFRRKLEPHERTSVKSGRKMHKKKATLQPEDAHGAMDRKERKKHKKKVENQEKGMKKKSSPRTELVR